MQNSKCPECGSTFSYPEGHVPAFCSICGARLYMTAEIQAPAEAEADSAGSVQAAKPRIFERTEIIGAILSYLAFYFYIEMLDCESKYCWPVLIVAAFIIAFTIMLNRQRKATTESLIWLSCLCISVICFVFGIGSVWEDYQVSLFMHLFAVWWVLSRSGMLTEADRGDYLPTNALTGFIILPFSNFFLRTKTVAGGIRQLRIRKQKRAMNWWLIPAVLISALLFYAALQLLSKADSLFENMLSDILDSLHIELGGKVSEIFFRFLMSLPVGCWLFGLIVGARHADRKRLVRRKKNVETFLDKIRRLPSAFWEAVIVIFSVLYLAFFILQGSYLFGAFTGKLPEGFIVAEYARQGFFELCKIMAVNAVVLWLTTHLSRTKQNAKRLNSFCLILLLESILFAVIAFSKLALYISIYGFTPLRLQSSWLVCVLFAGCVLWILNLFTGKRVFRLWMYFSGITLTLLMLY